MSDQIAYKIFQMSEWESFQNQGHFKGSAVDVKDGYIHLSNEDQVQGTLDKHYTQGVDVVISAIDLGLLSEHMRYEVSRGGAKFPHLYADLPLNSVLEFGIFKANDEGRYDFNTQALVST